MLKLYNNYNVKHLKVILTSNLVDRSFVDKMLKQADGVLTKVTW